MDNPTSQWTEAGDRTPESAKFFWTGGPVQLAEDTWFSSMGAGVTAFSTARALAPRAIPRGAARLGVAVRRR
ncbi:hypothetical protein [Streptacidiphilus fuscans]|uniref:Uncharacterized protein n=1 Tax=Streptacidiphilus fuscans TaxID=2789292 RepID=A0A931B4W5_9ACTN|nr:hypothetical protein [Streptacidiphilus fuscans]MBF9069046.1 hypothetical protein [Streptacidiphilus fuscans]